MQLSSLVKLSSSVNCHHHVLRKIARIREKNREAELKEKERQRNEEVKNVQKQLKDAERESIVGVYSLSQVEKLKVPELRDQLKKHGLLVSGKKADLVKRLTEFLQNSTLLMP